MDRFPLEKVRLYNFAKHHVIPGTQSTSVSTVARNLVGLHAARLPTPYVALHPRLTDFRPSDLRNRLVVSHSLIKLRCMRRTLHIVPLDLAPIVHCATLYFRITDCERKYRTIGISRKRREELKREVIRIVATEPSSAMQIEKNIHSQSRDLTKLKANTALWKLLVKTLIKDLWERGILCYLNISPKWDSEQRLYALTEQVYPGVNLGSYDEQEAQQLLIYHYIKQFGPVTERDISWWSGISQKKVRECLRLLPQEVVRLEIDNFVAPFYMLASEYDNFQETPVNGSNWLCLLAYEDPSLKGYYESRYRYVEAKYYPLLFNQIGEVRPSIVVNGQVVGIWAWNKRKCSINWTTFVELEPTFNELLLEAIARLESCLGREL